MQTLFVVTIVTAFCGGRVWLRWGCGLPMIFNNILQGAISNISLAEYAGRREGSINPLPAALASLNLAADLTKRVLEFSHQQTNGDDVVDLAAFVRNAEPILRPLLGDQIDLRIGAPETSVVVPGDRENVERALILLAENAREAMPPGGTFTLELAETSGGRMRLSVSDTGRGMDEVTRQRAFEPFFSTKGLGSGRATGMGLATVWGIVNRFGGEVEIDSVPGEGTTVRIDLPLRETSNATIGERPRVPTEMAGHETTLFVEDELEAGALMIESLKVCG